MREDFKQIFSLAEKIRLSFEEIAKNNREVGYGSYQCLGGYCCRASVQLMLAAKELGYNVGILASDWHVFNIYDGYIIDITATQFGKKKKIWMAKANKSNLRNWWKPRVLKKEFDPICYSVDELFRKCGWFISKQNIYRDKRKFKKIMGEETCAEL